MTRRWVWAALVCTTGCGLSAPQVGRPASDGVAQARFEVRSAHTDLVKVDVFFPADADGRPLPGELRPGLVYVQGGAVGISRYHWLAAELARRGMVVALPEHPLALAFFSADTGLAAADLLESPPQSSVLAGLVDGTKLGVAGHSLGGVVAGKLALSDRFAALAFNASYPDSADTEAIARFPHPSLSLAGELDCSAKLEKVTEGFETLPSPAALAVLSGVTHYQFTDSQAEDEQRGCTPAVELDVAHQRIADAMETYFRAAFSSEPGTGADALAQQEGVTVTTR